MKCFISLLMFVLFVTVAIPRGFSQACPAATPSCSNKDTVANRAAAASPKKISSVIATEGLTGGGDSGDISIGIAAGGVTTSKIADGAVTVDKLAAGNPQSGQVLTQNSGSLSWQTPVSPLRIFDSTGKEAGFMFSFPLEYRLLFRFPLTGEWMTLPEVHPIGFTNVPVSEFFTTTDCSGVAYAGNVFPADSNDFFGQALYWNGQVYYAAALVESVTVVARKTSPSAACQSVTPAIQQRRRLLSIAVTDLGLTPPFHLGQ